MIDRAGFLVRDWLKAHYQGYAVFAANFSAFLTSKRAIFYPWKRQRNTQGKPFVMVLKHRDSSMLAFESFLGRKSSRFWIIQSNFWRACNLQNFQRVAKKSQRNLEHGGTQEEYKGHKSNAKHQGPQRFKEKYRWLIAGTRCCPESWQKQTA